MENEENIHSFKRMIEDMPIDGETVKTAISYYTCRLGDTFKLRDGSEVRRVPGGWIQSTTNSGITNSIYVPYSEEYKNLISC